MKGYHFDSANQQIIITCGVWPQSDFMYIFKVNKRNNRRPEICSNLKMRIPEQYKLMLFWCCHC